MMASFKHHLDASLMNSVLPCSKKRREMMINKDFSELPADVLSIIIRKLLSPSDLVWFGAVCDNWRYVLIRNPNKHFNFPSSLPVLLLPAPSSSSTTDEEGKENITTSMTGIRLSSLCKGKIHDFSLPISGNFCGSSHGWLVVATGSNHNYSVKLLNPFISFNNEIELPSATNLKHDPNNYNYEDCLGKVVLSASPSSSSSNRGTGEVIVMAIHGKYSTLSYCRLGDNAWTALPFKWIEKVDDVIYCKGLFYGILHNGLVFTIEIPVAGPLDITPKVNVIAHPHRPPQAAEYCNGGSHYFTANYLVESSGEILQVIMEKMLIKEDCSVHYRTLGFHVYKLAKVVDNNNEKYLWEEAWSLDGISLFISFKVSISLSASDFPGCKPNCIYFSEYYEKPRHGCRDWVGTPNIEIYDLEDMIFHEKSHLTRYGFSPPYNYPIWIQPKL